MAKQSLHDLEGFSARVNYAAQCIRRNSTGGRMFDTCFEMYAGDYVVAMLMRKAAKNPDFDNVLRAHLRNSLSHWLEIAASFDGLSDRELRQAAKRCRDAAVAARQSREKSPQ